MLAEVRMARIGEVLGRYRSGRLSCVEAAELLGMSERHFRRLRDRYEAEGADGLVDRRRGRVSGRRAPVDKVEWVIDQFVTRYFDFTVKHFHEKLVDEHGIVRDSAYRHRDDDHYRHRGKKKHSFLSELFD